MKNQVAVIGLGRFGSAVANSLYNLGHDVLAMDKDDARVQSMMGKATHALAGDATDEQVFKELGIPDYDVAIVAIGVYPAWIMDLLRDGVAPIAERLA